MRKDATNIPPGVAATLPVTASKVSRPPFPYSKCVESKQLTVNNESKVYTFSTCNSLCVQKEVEKICNCSSLSELFVDKFNPGLCLKILKENLPLTIKRMNCEQEALIKAQKISSMKTCGCYMPCKNSAYNGAPSMAKWPTKSATLHFLKKFVLSSNLRQRFENELGPFPPYLDALNETSSIQRGIQLKYSEF